MREGGASGDVYAVGFVGVGGAGAVVAIGAADLIACHDTLRDGSEFARYLDV